MGAGARAAVAGLDNGRKTDFRPSFRAEEDALDFATWQLALVWPKTHQSGLVVHVAALVQGMPRQPTETFSLPSQASIKVNHVLI